MAQAPNIPRLSLAYNAIIGGIRLNDLEFHGSHATTDKEQITLANGSVSVQEVWLQINFEQASGDALDGIINRKDVNALAVFDVGTGMERNNISETDTKILTDDYSRPKLKRCQDHKPRSLVRYMYSIFYIIGLAFVNANLGVLDTVVCHHDQDSVTALLSLDEDHISTEELEHFHGGGRKSKNRVVVVGSIVDNQLVWGVLLAQNSGCGIMRRVGVCVLAVGEGA